MNRILFAIAIIGTLGLLTFQSAHAGRGWFMNPGPGCPYRDYAYSQSTGGAYQKNIDAFLKNTQDLRKNLAMKQAAYGAIMNSANPDPAKAAGTAEEIFQLRQQLRVMAEQAGLQSGWGNWGGGYGRGYMYGPRGGWGPGGGWGPCRRLIN